MSAFDSMFWHVTPRGKVSWAYYALRRLFVAPAPPEDRCIMGGPVDPAVHCPRYADDHDGGGWWCAHHHREIAREKSA